MPRGSRATGAAVWATTRAVCSGRRSTTGRRSEPRSDRRRAGHRHGRPGGGRRPARAGRRRRVRAPGVHNLALWPALADAGIRLVGVRHEQATVYAADGLARATGGLGVALTTTGPGAANTVGAVGEAWASHSPVVLIATDIPTTQRRPGVYRGVLHESIAQAAMFVAITKATIDVADADGHRHRDRQRGHASPGATPTGPVYVGHPHRPARRDHGAGRDPGQRLDQPTAAMRAGCSTAIAAARASARVGRRRSDDTRARRSTRSRPGSAPRWSPRTRPAASCRRASAARRRAAARASGHRADRAGRPRDRGRQRPRRDEHHGLAAPAPGPPGRGQRRRRRTRRRTTRWTRSSRRTPRIVGTVAESHRPRGRRGPATSPRSSTGLRDELRTTRRDAESSSSWSDRGRAARRRRRVRGHVHPGVLARRAPPRPHAARRCTTRWAGARSASRSRPRSAPRPRLPAEIRPVVSVSGDGGMLFADRRARDRGPGAAPAHRGRRRRRGATGCCGTATIPARRSAPSCAPPTSPRWPGRSGSPPGAVDGVGADVPGRPRRGHSVAGAEPPARAGGALPTPFDLAALAAEEGVTTMLVHSRSHARAPRPVSTTVRGSGRADPDARGVDAASHRTRAG